MSNIAATCTARQQYKRLNDGYARALASRTMTSLNLANNNIGAEGASHLAEGVKGHVSALRFNWCNFELDLTSGSTTVVPRGHWRS